MTVPKQPPHIPRKHARQQLVLKVEFDDADGFRSNYLTDLSDGGVRIETSMEVGQRVLLNISFLGFVEPQQLDAIVQWTLPPNHPEGPASGLAFVDLADDARHWLSELLDASTNVFVSADRIKRSFPIV